MKIVLLTMSVLASSWAIAQDLNAGLLLHYNFNGSANDVSGNGMNATVYGPVPAENDLAQPATAYLFDGINDYMQLPNNSLIKPQLPVTFYCHLKVNNFNTYTNFINTDDVDNVFTGMWMSSTVAGVVAVGYGDGGAIATTFSRRSAQTYNSLQMGQWHYVVGILRGPTDMEIWIDCEPQELLYTGTGGALQYSQNPGVLGKMDTGNFNYPPDFAAVTMNALAFWDRDLSSEEIEMLCERVLNTNETEKEIDTDILVVYPNPATSNFAINLQHFEGLKQVMIFDVAGKLVRRFEGNDSTIQVNGFEPGVYMVSVTNGQKHGIQRVVVR
jgi:hypothetical protein